jgi:phage terminase small subunit
LARIGLANMQDYVAVGPDGETRFIDPARLSRDQAATLHEMIIEEFTDHGKTKRRVRYKLADKRAALVDIGRHRLVPGPEPCQCERRQLLLGAAAVDG